MKFLGWMVVILSIGLTTLAQHKIGTYTTEKLNQIDSSGRYQGYWVIFVDSNFQSTDSANHDFCFLVYFYNHRTFHEFFLYKPKRDNVKLDLTITLVDGKKMINGKFVRWNKRSGLHGGS